MFRNLRKLHLVQRFIIFIHLLYSTTRNYCVSIQNISLISLVSPQIQSNTLISIIFNVDNNDFYSLKLGSVAIKHGNTLINTLMCTCVIHWLVVDVCSFRVDQFSLFNIECMLTRLSSSAASSVFWTERTLSVFWQTVQMDGYKKIECVLVCVCVCF